MDKTLWTYRFRIEVWVEHRDIPELPLRVRARVRDMEQGETKVVGSMQEIREVIESRLDEEGLAPRRWEREP